MVMVKNSKTRLTVSHSEVVLTKTFFSHSGLKMFPTVKPRSCSRPSCHDHMPVVLDCIIRAPWELPSDDSPPVSVDPLSRNQSPLLLFSEGASVNPWIQLIIPS